MVALCASFHRVFPGLTSEASRKRKHCSRRCVDNITAGGVGLVSRATWRAALWWAEGWWTRRCLLSAKGRRNQRNPLLDRRTSDNRKGRLRIIIYFNPMPKEQQIWVHFFFFFFFRSGHQNLDDYANYLENTYPSCDNSSLRCVPKRILVFTYCVVHSQILHCRFPLTGSDDGRHCCILWLFTLLV